MALARTVHSEYSNEGLADAIDARTAAFPTVSELWTAADSADTHFRPIMPVSQSRSG
jgi:hypothetical protein